MTFTEMALRMYPFWIMGIFTLISVYFSSHRDLIRVEWKPLLKWIGFLVVITIYRIVVFKLLAGNPKLHQMTSAANFIPWQSTLMVFWEDACHTLPLVIISRALGQDKWWKKLLLWAMMAAVALSFGLGHVYQGYIAAFLLSFYIPFTFKRGQKIGFGTVMLCHILYDLSTILTIKFFLG